MRILQDTNIDFMKYRKYWVLFSLALILIGVYVVFFSKQLNLGIDFAGGTQMTVKFAEEPDLGELRGVIEAAGIADPLIQRFGDAGSHEVLLKTPVAEEGEERRRCQIETALDGWLGQTDRVVDCEDDQARERWLQHTVGGMDLNRSGADAVAEWLAARNPEVVEGDASTIRAHYDNVAQAIADVRRETGHLPGLEAIQGVVEPATAAALNEGATFGKMAILGAERVSAQVGSELRQRGVLAVSLALLGMLAYIWWRFELRFGIGALVAVIHDVFITLSLFTLAGFEFNLTTIAGFLTLVGYSVNDSVVVFDRVRENLRQLRSLPLIDVMNKSLNQTLSRTILTSSTTLLAVGSLLLLGGDVLKGFAFILFVGVLAGTYSSIYIASPFALLWEKYFGGKRASGRAATVST